MKFQVPDDIGSDMKDWTGFFDTVSLVPTKRKYGDAFYDITWVPRKRRDMPRGVIASHPIHQRLGKRRQFRTDQPTARPVKKRLTMSDAVHSGLLIQGKIVIPPKAGAWRLDEQTGDVDVNELAEMVGRLHIEKMWPQFSRLPPELRRLIWQHTWENRAVTIKRKVVDFKGGPQVPLDLREAPYTSHNATRHYKTSLVRRDWGVLDPISDELSSRAHGKDFVTSTTTDSKPPVSLFVNHESRHETLLHFQTAFALDGSDAKVYYNFALDSLKLPRHHPLGLCFDINDLQKLTSITVPELFPNLTCFTRKVGPFDFHRSRMVLDAQIPPAADDTVAYYPEFDRAWQLLRWRFPNLREINLEPVSDCKLHKVEEPLIPSRPIRIEHNPWPEKIDQYCNSCENLRNGAVTRFPSVGLNTPYLERVFDGYGFYGSPAYKRARVVVGIVKKEGKKDEEVTVTFWRIRHHLQEHTYSVFIPRNLRSTKNSRAGRDNVTPPPDGPQTFELECLAKSLERFLGPPTKHDYLALDI
ncbi:hypothetical protein PG984_015913 [Apiospora sp. TS-2023a]